MIEWRIAELAVRLKERTLQEEEKPKETASGLEGLSHRLR
jgi:hypothetical protein